MSEADDAGAQQRYRYQHERREDEFDDFDGDDANVLDGIYAFSPSSPTRRELK